MGTEGGWDRVSLWPGLPVLTAGHLRSTPRQGLCSWVREDPVPVLPCTTSREAAPTDSSPGPRVRQGLGSGTGQHAVRTAVRWPRMGGCTGPERLQGSPRDMWLDLPADGCPQEPRGGSLGKASKHHRGLCFCSWQKDSAAPQKLPVRGFKKHTAAFHGRYQELSPRASALPSSESHRKSTHRSQSLGDRFRASKRVIENSPLSPSPVGWDGHVSMETMQMHVAVSSHSGTSFLDDWTKLPPSATRGQPRAT